MAVPDYQSLMLPFLQQLADGEPHQTTTVRQGISSALALSADDLAALLPSGKQPLFDNRVGWAKTYLERAGLISTVKRGTYVLTPRGKQVLVDKPARVDNDYLLRFKEFSAFLDESHGSASAPSSSEPVGVNACMELDPLEALETLYQQLRHTLEVDLLNRVRESSPSFFEKLVVELIVKMGYGGSQKDAGKAIGRTGDDGLDGVIKEDHLGLDSIYLQAKRWKNTVGRPDVQAFAGSLEGVRGRKGVFITTSTFSAEAREYVQRIEKRIVLIDGQHLAALMVDFDIGVSVATEYRVKRLDGDYFEEE